MNMAGAVQSAKKQSLIHAGNSLSKTSWTRENSENFDTLHHNILLKRQQTTFRIPGSALQWLRSYIMNRSQVVVVNGISSIPKCLDFAVPQGLVPGPMLLFSTPSSLYASSAGVVVTFTSFQVTHSFSFLPLLLILAPSSNRQSSVSRLSQLAWVPTCSNVTMTKRWQLLSVPVPEQTSSVVSISRLIVIWFLFQPKVKNLRVVIESV